MWRFDGASLQSRKRIFFFSPTRVVSCRHSQLMEELDSFRQTFVDSVPPAAAMEAYGSMVLSKILHEMECKTNEKVVVVQTRLSMAQQEVTRLQAALELECVEPLSGETSTNFLHPTTSEDLN